MGRAARQDKNAGGLPRDLVAGIINAVGIEEPSPSEKLIALAPGTQEIDGVPQSKLVKKKLKESGRKRALSEAVAIDDDDNFPCDTQHLRYDRRRIWKMMQGAEFADGIEAPIGKRQRVTGSLEKGNGWSDSRGDTLLDKGGDGLYAAGKRARESGSELAQASSIGRTYIQETLDLQ